MKSCPHCGNQNPDDVRFCRTCGAPFGGNVMAFCRVCGTPIDPVRMVCPNCNPPETNAAPEAAAPKHNNDAYGGQTAAAPTFGAYTAPEAPNTPGYGEERAPNAPAFTPAGSDPANAGFYRTDGGYRAPDPRMAYGAAPGSLPPNDPAPLPPITPRYADPGERKEGGGKKRLILPIALSVVAVLLVTTALLMVLDSVGVIEIPLLHVGEGTSESAGSDVNGVSDAASTEQSPDPTGEIDGTRPQGEPLVLDLPGSTASVTVFSGPGTGYERLGSVSHGETVYIQKSTDDGEWTRIVTGDGSLTGWISAVDAGLRAAPAVDENREIPIARISASSDQGKGSEERRYTPDQAIDGDYNTCWMAAAKNNGKGGVGNWIQANLDKTTPLNGIKLLNGNGWNGMYQGKQVATNLYNINGRIRDFTLTFSDGTVFTFTAADVREESFGRNVFRFPHAVDATWVRLTVDSAYIGTKWDTVVCLSELALF